MIMDNGAAMLKFLANIITRIVTALSAIISIMHMEIITATSTIMAI